MASAITCVIELLGNLRQAEAGKVILIGSVNGLENSRRPEVAYSASKFGLRGVAHALREQLRMDRIPVTCINPGSIETGFPYEEGAARSVAHSRGESIPMHDLVAIVRCVMNLSSASCVKEIDIPSITDREA